MFHSNADRKRSNNKKVSYAELIFANLAFLGACWLFESNLIKKHIFRKIVMYDNIKLVCAGKEAELKKELEERLGLNITNIEIGTIDLLKDMAILSISYTIKSAEPNTIETMNKSKYQYMD